MGRRDLCPSSHLTYAKHDVARLTTEMYLSNLKPAMKPSDAYAHIALHKTERVEIDKLEGRITVGLVTPYPPGIPLLGTADVATVVARVFTVVYFLFFLLMPWYTARDKTLPVPERVPVAFTATSVAPRLPPTTSEPALISVAPV